ncbi:hypothetical protein I3760_03G116200 [Carya illinoinensis]|nr:hypothetical protein I3760_03G116200 [Carya illinoinensis]
MFVGVAASRVKDLFASARSFAPSIIFIDEIDAIGSKRGGPDIGGGGAEREQGLLQILTELDGFKVSTSQVLVIGAMNRLDILDPALLRNGCFDKIIRVGLPSKDGRFAILKVFLLNMFIPFWSEEHNCCKTGIFKSKKNTKEVKILAFLIFRSSGINPILKLSMLASITHYNFYRLGLQKLCVGCSYIHIYIY